MSTAEAARVVLNAVNLAGLELQEIGATPTAGKTSDEETVRLLSFVCMAQQVLDFSSDACHCFKNSIGPLAELPVPSLVRGKKELLEMLSVRLSAIVNTLGFSRLPTLARRTSILCLAVLCSPANTQSTVGIQPYGTYATSGADSVNLSDLGVHIEVPLFSHPGRGVGMGTNIRLVYDSSYISPVGAVPSSDVGWRLVPSTTSPGTVSYQKTYSEFFQNTCNPGLSRCNAGYWQYTYSFFFTDPSGYTHLLDADVMSQQCVGGGSPDPCTNAYLSDSGQTYDGSGYSFSINPNTQSAQPLQIIVTSPSGITYNWQGLTTVTDTNGNNAQQPAIVGPGSTWTESLTDNTGVTATINGGGYSPTNTTQWTSRAPLIVQYTDTQGNQQSVTVNYTLQNIGQSCSGGPTYSETVGLVSSVVYPDGTNYQFTYQPDGQLASMKLPTGGTITYSVGSLCSNGSGLLNGTNGLITGLPATLTRTTADGSTTYTTALTLTNSPGNATATKITSVAYPDGSSEQVVFADAQFSLGNGESGMLFETAHSWFSPQGATLRSTMRCYDGASGDCTTTAIKLPLTQISTTTTLDSGQTSQTAEFLNTKGLQTELDEYDYGANSPLRKTLTSYASLGNNILDRPSSIVVQDGSGNTVQSTSFGYDESTPTPTNSLPGHSAASGSRGNQTSVHAWVNTGGTISTSKTYDDAGDVTSSNDAFSNATYYSYAQEPIEGSRPTSITFPSPGNGVTLSASTAFDSYDGLPLSSTDEAGQATTYRYDSMFRPILVSYPDGGSTQTSYVFGSNTVSVASQVAASPNPTENSSLTLDGYGRTIISTSANGATSETAYDSRGRLWTVTNPHFSGPASGTTTYLYDGLGRKTWQQDADGTNTRRWGYSGNSVTYTDESGNQWNRSEDALGRLTRVLEPSPTSPAPTLETDYIYDVLGNLKSVNQHGSASETPRTRSFTYDSLSRLLSSTNPETGLTQYAYLTAAGNACSGDPSSPCSKMDSNGVSINYTYDPDNRLSTRISTDSPASVNYTYQYDSATLGQGKLGSVTSTNGTGYKVSAYDQMGREKVTQWMNPTTSAWQTGATATYDYGGHLLTLTYPDARVITQAYDSGANLISVADTTSGSPANFFAGAQYWPNGSLSTAAIGNYVTESISINSRLQPCHIQASTSTLPPVTGAGNLFDRELFYQQNAETNCGTASSNNGNIWAVLEGPAHDTSQSFMYDHLNRLTSASSVNRPAASSYSFVYQNDSFGNMVPVDQLHTPTPYGSNAATNQLTLPGLSYDSKGQMATAPTGTGGTHSLSYTAEGYLSCIDACSVGSYLTDGMGNRAVASSSVGPSHQYVYFQGQPIAIYDSTGTWTDYIYANGERVASSTSGQATFTLSGSGPQGSITGQVAGILQSSGQFSLTSGSVTVGGSTYFLLPLGIDTSASSFEYDNLLAPAATTPGQFDWYGALFGSGTAQFNLYADGPGICAYLYNNGIWTYYGFSSFAVTAAGTLSPGGPTAPATHYFLSDQVGTTQMELAADSTIVWQGYFTPFGQEIVGGGEQTNLGTVPSDGTVNRYKFTGKERDAESGLDYFGARYYASAMGRFMSPDPGWSRQADLTNPQTWNQYAYVLNNPLRFTDPSGMECVWDDGSYDSADDPDTGNAAGCSGQGGTYVNPDLFENALLTNGQNANIQYGSWSGQANSTIASSWTTSSSTTTTTDDGTLLNAVQNSLGSVQQNGFYLQGIHDYTAMDVFNWAATGNHTPNGCASGVVGCLYHYGHWCGAGGSGAPTDTTDAACLVHDFLYAQYGFTAGSNYNGYNPALQEINQGLCDTAGSGAISAYFGFGVAIGNAAKVNWTGNASCK